MKKSKCRGCGRDVVWAVDEADGKRRCLDAVSPVYEVQDPEDPLAHEVPPTCRRHKGAFVLHFVTCPARDMFSSKSKKQPTE